MLMKELELNELKDIQFQILKVFDLFCRENDIRYYLGYGTLLGAIRYKKFIPWDDDIDVLVPRVDYERLIKLFQDSERYKLFAFEKNPNFLYSFAKLCDMTTRKEQTVYKNKKVVLGVEIDIFPLDAWNPDFEKAKNEAKRVKRNMSFLKLTKLDKLCLENPMKQVQWGAIRILAKMIGGKHFIKNIIKISKAVPLENAAYVGAKAWSIYGERGIIPAEAFTDVVYVEFEGEMFPAPAGYDTYLTCLYGDYMPEPPLEKQKTHHAFRAYRL